MNVLLLSDFSEVAINATHYAMDLLQDHQANFYLLNIFDPDPDCVDQCAENIRSATLATLDERVKKLQQRAGNRPHNVKGHYSEARLVNAARDFVTRYNIDLIVMGAVGKEQRYATILGKHTFEIMSKIKCNTLAVTQNSSFKKPERLLMPLDYTASFGRKNIRFLKNSGIFNNAHLNILELSATGNSVDERDLPKKEIFNALKDIKVDFSKSTDIQIYDKSAWADLQKEFDLIVLLGKNIRICDRLLHDQHSLYKSEPNQLPILVLHD